MHHFDSACRHVENVGINAHGFTGRINHGRPYAFTATADDRVAHGLDQLVFACMCVGQAAVERVVNALLIVFQSGNEVGFGRH